MMKFCLPVLKNLMGHNVQQLKYLFLDTPPIEILRTATTTINIFYKYIEGSKKILYDHKNFQSQDLIEMTCKYKISKSNFVAKTLHSSVYR